MLVWEESPLFLSHKGVDVYHVYKHDMESNGARYYWYGLHPNVSDGDGEDGGVFDVRDLQAFWTEPSGDVKNALMAAIDSGELQPYVEE